MVKTDVEGHDLVILRFELFSNVNNIKLKPKMRIFVSETHCTGIWSHGFDPKYFGLNGGGILYWTLTSTKVI